MCPDQPSSEERAHLRDVLRRADASHLFTVATTLPVVTKPGLVPADTTSAQREARTKLDLLLAERAGGVAHRR